MKSIRYHITLLLSATALLTAGVSSAQQINTEVEIRYEETPRLTELNKLTLTPTMILPETGKATLSYSTRNPSITLPGTITTLDPAGYADTIYASPYRGYAAIGFMPRFNLGASAGYKILNNDHTRLSAFLQYDGTSYKPSGWEDLIKRNTATIGTALHQAVGKESFLDAALDYTYAGFNYPATDNDNQNANRLNVSALWSMTHSKWAYGIGAGYHFFNFAKSPVTDIHSQRENNITARAFVGRNLTSTSSFGLSVDMSYLNNPRQVYRTDSYTILDGARSSTLIDLTPSYSLTSGKLSLRLGVHLDIIAGHDKGFHIAPDLNVTWSPSSLLKVYLLARGGEHQNTLASVFSLSPYVNPVLSYNNSYVPVNAELGVTFGSWRGLYARVSASFARAVDWLKPVATPNSDLHFLTADINGFKMRAEVGYNFRNIVEANARFEHAPGNRPDRGYYLWTDNARTVVGASLTVRPISALDVNLGWEYRGRRSIYSYDYDLPVSPVTSSLGSVNSLNAGALYRITPQWSAFLRGENLLNHQYDLIGFIPAQGRTGLLGVTYKF